MADQRESSVKSTTPTQREPGTTGQSGQQVTATRPGRGDVSRRGQQMTYFPSPAEFFSNPFAVMRRMHEDMDRVFSQALGGTGGAMMSAGPGSGAGGGLASWSPAIEVQQKGNNLIVCAELPGLKPDEVHVEVNEDALVIEGERKQEQSSDEGGVHRTERHYGRFYRAVPLPEGANTDQAKAEFRDGVLEVTVPVPEQQSRRRQIPVSSGSSQTSGINRSSQSSGSSGTSQGGNTGSSQR